MIENFILELLKEINNFYKCYYEEAPNESRFPYLVSPSVAVTPLNAGYLCLFDIEIFNNIISTISVENIIDTLIKKLDGYNFKNENIAFHVGFENVNILKIQEQDLTSKKVSFSARVFGKEN